MKAFSGLLLLALCCLSIAAAVLGVREKAVSPASFLDAVDAVDAKSMSSRATGRFTGIYHHNLMEPDWLFPCDGTQPLQVEQTPDLWRHAETIHKRFPGALVRRNGVYLAALGMSEISGEQRSLHIRVILSMSPDRPADCRTPERDHAMAMPPPLASD